MKKILIFLTAIFSIFGLVSCGGNNNPTDTGTDNNGTTENGGNSGNENNGNTDNNGNTGENTEGEQNKPDENLILGKYTAEEILRMNGCNEMLIPFNLKNYIFVDQQWVEENVMDTSKKFSRKLIVSTIIDEQPWLYNFQYNEVQVPTYVCLLEDKTKEDFEADKKTYFKAKDYVLAEYKTDYMNWVTKIGTYGGSAGDLFDSNNFYARWHEFLINNSEGKVGLFSGTMPKFSLTDYDFIFAGNNYLDYVVDGMHLDLFYTNEYTFEKGVYVD